MADDESFSYGSETIGGSSPTHNTHVLDHYMFYTTQDDAEFSCRFVVEAASYSALASACQAIEANLRMRYQRLEVDFGGSAQDVFEPSVSAGTYPSSGFDQEPHLEKVRDFPNSGLARAYDFRVRLSQYPNYTDSFGAAAGRRQVDAGFHYDASEKRVVTMTGEWTQVPSSLARAQFLSQFDGSSGYASYRLGLINTAIGSTGVTWALTRREESDPNSLSTLRFTREYSEHLYGRRSRSVEIFYGEQSRRTVTVRGTYLRTVAVTNLGTVAQGSVANFEDTTNGGVADAIAVLAAFTTAQGGPLLVGVVTGSNCEMVNEPSVATNEQDDRTDYAIVFRELLFKQSSHAGGGMLDDPDLIGDTCVFASVYAETNDSPEPVAAAAVPGPDGSTAPPTSGSGATTANPGGGSAPATVSKTPLPGSQPPATPAGTSTAVTKPVELFISYEAFVAKSYTNSLYIKWQRDLLPYLLSHFNDQLGFSGMELVDQKVSADPTSNKLSASLHCRAYTGDLVVFLFTMGLANDLGVRVDGAFAGTPHAYLVQQGLPKSTMTRRVEAVYRASSSFSLDKYKTPPATTGWVKLNDSQPATTTRVLGVPNQGVGQTSLTYAVLEEQLVWVAKNVAGSSGSSPTPASNRTPTGLNMSPAPDAAPALNKIATGGA